MASMIWKMEDLNKTVMSCISIVILLCRLQQYLGLLQTFSTKMRSHLRGDKSDSITWTMPSDKVPEDQEAALSSLCLSSSLSEGQKLTSCSVAALPFESSNSSALACEQKLRYSFRQYKGLQTTLFSFCLVYLYCVFQISPFPWLYSSAARRIAAGWHW